MLLKRLDVTVQSFGWSDRAKVRSNLLLSKSEKGTRYNNGQLLLYFYMILLFDIGSNNSLIVIG